MRVDEPMRFCASFIYGCRCTAPFAPFPQLRRHRNPDVDIKAFGSYVAQNSVALRSLPNIKLLTTRRLDNRRLLGGRYYYLWLSPSI